MWGRTGLWVRQWKRTSRRCRLHGCLCRGFWSINVADPANPVALDRYPVTPDPNIAYDVFYSSDIAYLASDLGGLVLLDASNPANLTELGVYASTVWRGV